MRYRPFGDTGTAVSAVSLALTPSPAAKSQDVRDLIFEALEQGINAFEVMNPTSAVVDGVAEGLQVLDRGLTFVTLRLAVGPEAGSADPEDLESTIRGFITRTGFGSLDLIMLDDPAEGAVPEASLAVLKGLREEGVTKLLGIAGESPSIDGYIATKAFDVLSLPYSIRSGWITRGRLRAAQEIGMVMIGTDFFPEFFAKPTPKPAEAKRGLFKSSASYNPLAGAGTYAFMHETPQWTAEEICLAFALTEPSIATVQVTSEARARLAELCSVVERDLPAGLISRIEMGRFSEVKASTT